MYKRRKIAERLKPARKAGVAVRIGLHSGLLFYGVSFLLFLCCICILFTFAAVKAKGLYADTITAIPDSPYSCRETDSGNQLLKEKDDELVSVSFSKVKKKLQKKIKKFRKKEKKRNTLVF